jgi:hypothetical protein
MKTKITLILMLLFLAGCQSEIDKCVAAIAAQGCVNASNKKFCTEDLTEALGGDYRMHCLKAQAGKE